MAVSVNVVVLAGTIAADPVERRMPSGEECTEFRLSVTEPGRRLLPLPVVAWHTEVHTRWLASLRQGDEVLVYGRLVRRFCRSGAGARSLGEGDRPQTPGARRAGRPRRGAGRIGCRIGTAFSTGRRPLSHGVRLEQASAPTRRASWSADRCRPASPISHVFKGIVISTTLHNELPLGCPSCGSAELTLTYRAPVWVHVREREVVSVRVDDEQTLFAGSALCTLCGRRWSLAEEPENGLWPGWEFGP